MFSGDWSAISSTAFAVVDFSASSLANRLWKGVTAHCLLDCNLTRVFVVIERDRKTRDVGDDCSARKAERRKRYLSQERVSNHTIFGVYVDGVMTYIWMWGSRCSLMDRCLEPDGKLTRFSSQGLLQKSVSHTDHTIYRILWLYPPELLSISATVFTSYSLLTWKLQETTRNQWRPQ